MRETVEKLEGSALDLALLISKISVRIFGQIWNPDIEWDVRHAIDDGSNQISRIPRELDPGEGKLTSEEVNRLGKLLEALQGGWVVWVPDAGGVRGFVRDVSAEEWRDRVGTEEYRLSRYRADWLRLSRENLASAYGTDEPEYSTEMLKALSEHLAR
jgi:hypothetical protein